MKGDGLSLFNVETKEHFKLKNNDSLLYPEEDIIFNRTHIYFTL